MGVMGCELFSDPMPFYAISRKFGIADQPVSLPRKDMTPACGGKAHGQQSKRGGGPIDLAHCSPRGRSAHLTDRQLLERFTDRDGDGAELAFASLVERHGSMVLRVCRTI